MICGYETCDREVYAKGYCNGHWQQLRHRGGDPSRLSEFRKPKRGMFCEIEGCGRPVEGRGMCQRHVRVWRKTGEIVEIAEKQRRSDWGDSCYIRLCEGAPISKGYCRKHLRVAKQYNLTKAQAQDLFREFKCSVCGTEDSGKRDFHIDHDHSCCDRPGSCGKCVRGLLCGWCNRAMGSARDNPDLLRKMANYLESGGVL